MLGLNVLFGIDTLLIAWALNRNSSVFVTYSRGKAELSGTTLEAPREELSVMSLKYCYWSRSPLQLGLLGIMSL